MRKRTLPRAAALAAGLIRLFCHFVYSYIFRDAYICFIYFESAIRPAQLNTTALLLAYIHQSIHQTTLIHLQKWEGLFFFDSKGQNEYSLDMHTDASALLLSKEGKRRR